MTLACERCSLKVPCSYAGSSTQIDIYKLQHLADSSDHIHQKVDALEQRMEAMQSSLQALLHHLQPASHSSSSEGVRIRPLTRKDDSPLASSPTSCTIQPASPSHSPSSASPIKRRLPAAWDDPIVLTKGHPLYQSKGAFFPLYSAWESSCTHTQQRASTDNDTPSARPPSLPLPLLNRLLHHYAECFLCFPLPDIERFLSDCRVTLAQQDQQVGDERLLLVYALLAWSSRHAAIYHGLFQGQDPNTVGEPYFVAANHHLARCFLHPTFGTVHGLLLMYIYSIGKTGPSRLEASRAAYVYLGLAIRMSMDLGLHQPSPVLETSQQLEKRRRLYAAIEFMETLCGTHSEKPMMLPTSDIVTIGAPTPMAHETGEHRYRVEFTIHRHEISQIERRIRATLLPSTRPLHLATITTFEQKIKQWYQALPAYFQYQPDARRSWQSSSFREQACLKLTFEYHSLLCQLYSLFLPRADVHPPQKPQLSFIALLSLRICVDAADAMTELLGCWSQLQQPWCHFTLGTLVMACAVYSNYQLHDASVKTVAATKEKLLTIRHFLQSSPIQHHKHVKALMDRIHQDIQSSQPSAQTPTVLDPVCHERRAENKSPVMLGLSTTPPPWPPHPPLFEDDQLPGPCLMADQPLAPALEANFPLWTWFMPSQPPPDLTTPMDLVDWPFHAIADFVYTPNLKARTQAPSL
ncbi:hypothetical protein DM01DRAFT_1404798 [Hesseltinella vesiculosa]|uniref:Xylanolytic transcriptional activator regulatory domain-containing protein n=1 Tax=Hesseltinella vesiculosa TaxID=101127 RepID=A0A1X2GT15_9FUNG|nr:hypothetical protein DM01DRAFT_1404798 [Hesseltinella vesiculosa]